MPFHDYSSLSRTNKIKEQPCRHSSPPIYDLTKNTTVNAHDISALVKTDLLTAGQGSSDPLLIPEGNKPQKTPFRSNSNPACFEDYSKSKKDLRGYSALDRNKNQSLNLGIENPSFRDKVDSIGQKDHQKRLHSFNGTSSSNNVTKKQNGNSPNQTTIVINKPPVPTSSPSSGVKLRSKPANSPKSHRKRRGIILENTHSISSPILISHESSETGVKLRDLEQQEKLLTKLQIQPEEDKKVQKQQQNIATEPTNSVGTRMAERIQRTIRALYTSNSSPKREAFNLLNESNDSADEFVSGKPPAIKQSEYARLTESSPKSDKKVSRKRSPKPNLKNNLQVKDVDGSRRFKWRGSVNKIVKKFGTGQPFLSNGTFGVHLEDCPTSPVNEFVPFVVELCCRIVEDRGLHFTGIYRVPGNSAVLTALQEDLNAQGVESIRAEDERLRDLNVVSSLLKSFFRKLPEPLFTNELYHDFVQANRRPTSEERLNSLRRLVHMLPGPHYETLKFLITHLRLIADNCAHNKMEVRNLAIVFGPTLVRNTSSDNTTTMVTDMSDQCRIIESIIEHAEWFFSDTFDSAIEESHVASVPKEKEREAVPNIEFLLENVGRKPGDTGNNTSESTKSKASDDSEKDSFSRDLMEMIFGKRWRQTGQSNQPTMEDHGGFEDYEFRKQQEAAAKKKEAPTETEPSNPNILNVSERLMKFYNEHLERLSQTTIGATFPAFSSADSSPRTTPRHSTILNAPLVFPTPTRNFGSRNRLNSDEGRLVTSSSSNEAYQIHKTPPFPLPETLVRPKGAPQYIHPPNPYVNKVAANSTPKQTVNSQSTTTFSDSSALQSSARTTVSNSTRTLAQNNSPPTVKMRKHSSSRSQTTDGTFQVKKSAKENYMNPTQPNTIISEQELATFVQNESKEPLFANERLVDELPKPVQRRVSSPTTSTGSKSPKHSATNRNENTVEFKRRTSSSSVHVSEDNKNKQTKEIVRKTPSDGVMNTQRKKRKSPLKENVAVAKTIPERTFSRYDPKRRGIRFVGNENEPSHSGDAPGSPGKLTATERLFNGQPIRRKQSMREKKNSSVIRRHTLSGLQDLEQHSPALANNAFKSNLKQVAMGQNLSMYDLLTISGQGQSAMERLNPKGASSGMTLSNWIVQERLRNQTEQRNGCSLNTKQGVSKKESKSSKFHSYV